MLNKIELRLGLLFFLTFCYQNTLFGRAGGNPIMNGVMGQDSTLAKWSWYLANTPGSPPQDPNYHILTNLTSAHDPYGAFDGFKQFKAMFKSRPISVDHSLHYFVLGAHGGKDRIGGFTAFEMGRNFAQAFHQHRLNYLIPVDQVGGVFLRSCNGYGNCPLFSKGFNSTLQEMGYNRSFRIEANSVPGNTIVFSDGIFTAEGHTPVRLVPGESNELIFITRAMNPDQAGLSDQMPHSSMFESAAARVGVGVAMGAPIALGAAMVHEFAGDGWGAVTDVGMGGAFGFSSAGLGGAMAGAAFAGAGVGGYYAGKWVGEQMGVSPELAGMAGSSISMGGMAGAITAAGYGGVIGTGTMSVGGAMVAGGVLMPLAGAVGYGVGYGIGSIPTGGGKNVHHRIAEGMAGAYGFFTGDWNGWNGL